MMVRITPPCDWPALDRELITRKNTNSGAIAFSAPTNISPKIPIPEACGTTSARITPITKPAIIRFTRLIPVHLVHAFFMSTQSLPVY